MQLLPSLYIRLKLQDLFCQLLYLLLKFNVQRVCLKILNKLVDFIVECCLGILGEECTSQ